MCCIQWELSVLESCAHPKDFPQKFREPGSRARAVSAGFFAGAEVSGDPFESTGVDGSGNERAYAIITVRQILKSSEICDWQVYALL